MKISSLAVMLALFGQSYADKIRGKPGRKLSYYGQEDEWNPEDYENDVIPEDNADWYDEQPPDTPYSNGNSYLDKVKKDYEETDGTMRPPYPQAKKYSNNNYNSDGSRERQNHSYYQDREEGRPYAKNTYDEPTRPDYPSKKYNREDRNENDGYEKENRPRYPEKKYRNEGVGSNNERIYLKYATQEETAILERIGDAIERDQMPDPDDLMRLAELEQSDRRRQLSAYGKAWGDEEYDETYEEYDEGESEFDNEITYEEYEQGTEEYDNEETWDEYEEDTGEFDNEITYEEYEDEDYGETRDFKYQETGGAPKGGLPMSSATREEMEIIDKMSEDYENGKLPDPNDLIRLAQLERAH